MAGSHLGENRDRHQKRSVEAEPERFEIPGE
jgi:hypothetical protein